MIEVTTGTEQNRTTTRTATRQEVNTTSQQSLTHFPQVMTSPFQRGTTIASSNIPGTSVVTKPQRQYNYTTQPFLTKSSLRVLYRNYYFLLTNYFCIFIICYFVKQTNKAVTSSTLQSTNASIQLCDCGPGATCHITGSLSALCVCNSGYRLTSIGSCDGELQFF